MSGVDGMSWAEDELKNTRFRRSPPRTTPVNNRRREQRLLTIVEDLIAQPNASVLQASRDDAAVQGLYKFWSNRRITPAAILSGHIAQTVERSLQHPTVLTIQDTTELDFSTHRTTGA
jgi:hypothetical protein